MRIAYDHNIFTRQRFGGISRYIVHLASAVADAGHQVSIFAPIHGNAYVQQASTQLTAGWNAGAGFYRIKAPFLLINEWIDTAQIRHWKPDLLHETYYAAHRQAPSRTPVVVTVHDMTHERFPTLFSWRDRTPYLKAKAIARADSLICISEHTRKDLLEFHPQAAGKTKVIHHGFHPLPQPDPNGEHPLQQRPYLLFVGSRTGYKNFNNLAKAFAHSRLPKEGFQLVAFGGGNWNAEEKRLIKELGLSDHLHLSAGNDHALATYYRHARFFAFPSLYEGFGFPLLEAMSLDCPVACSNSSSFPEVAGNAARYFDPANLEDMRNAIEDLALSENERSALTENGRSRVAHFAWDHCLLQTLELYRETIEKKTSHDA